MQIYVLMFSIIFQENTAFKFLNFIFDILLFTKKYTKNILENLYKYV